MYKEVGICHAKKYANKVGMKAKVNIMAKPHPYIFFTLQLDSAWHNLMILRMYNVILRLHKFSDCVGHKHCNCKGKESWVSFLT